MEEEDPGHLLSGLREQVLPFTVVVVILAIVACEIPWLSPAMTPDTLVSRLLGLLAVCVIFSVFPAIPLLYGWYSGNRAGSILAGILPLPLFFLAGSILYPPADRAYLVSGTLPFVAVLAALLGLAGYCAAQRTKEYLAVSVVLTGFWLVFFLSGID